MNHPSFKSCHLDITKIYLHFGSRRKMSHKMLQIPSSLSLLFLEWRHFYLSKWILLNSHTEFSFDDSSLTTFEKVVLGIMLFLISIPGTVMLMILVQFDRIGGDPLKRRITDQVSVGHIPMAVENPFETKFIFKLFTSLNIMGIIVNAIFVIIRLLELILSNDLLVFASYLEILTHEFIQCFGSFVTFEIFFIKYWVEFVWKSVRNIDGSFIIIFLDVFK